MSCGRRRSSRFHLIGCLAPQTCFSGSCTAHLEERFEFDQFDALLNQLLPENDSMGLSSRALKSFYHCERQTSPRGPLAKRSAKPIASPFLLLHQTCTQVLAVHFTK